MRRSLRIALLLIGVILATTSAVEARQRPKQASKFEANKTFGLGIILGSPTGFCGKYYLSKDTALDFALGAYYGYRRHYDHYAGLHLHGDFLWHPAVLTKNDSFWLPLYVGVGARILDHDDWDDDRYDDTHLGVRVPFGLMFDFEKVPLDIFLEFALIADFFHFGDDYHDHFGVDLTFSLGFRYYF